KLQTRSTTMNNGYQGPPGPPIQQPYPVPMQMAPLAPPMQQPQPYWNNPALMISPTHEPLWRHYCRYDESRLNPEQIAIRDQGIRSYFHPLIQRRQDSARQQYSQEFKDVAVALIIDDQP